MMLRAKRYAAHVAVPGPDRACPICRSPLPNAEMAVNSHLRKHVREGELSREGEQALRMQVLGRTFNRNA